MTSPLLVARTGKAELVLLPALANRHGLITGATGTGKTVTLQTLAEQFSRAGVPVFMADVKGDLSGMAKAGGSHAKVAERAKQLGVQLRHEPCPVVFWDVYGAAGHPVCFIHPRASDEFPIAGEGVLVELVQAPPEVIRALG